MYVLQGAVNEKVGNIYRQNCLDMKVYLKKYKTTEKLTGEHIFKILYD